MAMPPAFVLLLLVLQVLEQGLCVDGTPQSHTTANTDARGGIRAKLIRRDHYFADVNDASSPREKVERAARRSLFRARYLQTKTQAAGTALTSPTPSPSPSPSPSSTPTPTPTPLPSSRPSPPSVSSDWETPLSDAAAGEYLMEIDLGTPPQKFVTIADTGSDLTWLNCAPCQSGCETGTTFQPTQSPTYGTLGCSSTTCRFLNESGPGSICPNSKDASRSACSYAYGYGDGSVTTGTLAQDTITLQRVEGGVQTVQDYWFGCSTNVVSISSLLDQTDGVVGLGRGNISFPRQLGDYFGYKFGYCLVNRSTDVQSTVFFFGKDAAPSDTLLQYTPLLSSNLSSTFYYVGCTGIALHGATIDTIPSSAFDIASDGTGGLVFDSGTTFTALAEHVFKPFVAALQAQISSNYTFFTTDTGFSVCYVVTSWNDWIADYGTGVPVITFQLSNTTGFTLAVDNAWIEVDPTSVCLTIQETTGPLSIFGNVQQMDFHVLYDLENEQIGFVKTKCRPAAESSNAQAQRAGFSLGTTLFLSLLAMTIVLTCQQ